MPNAPGVRVDLVAFSRFQKNVLDSLSEGRRGQVLGTVFKQWAARYRGFAQERFDAFSKGAGDWVPLALSTVQGRRKGKGKTKRMSLARDTSRGGRLVSAGGAFSILRDTGLLFAALTPEFQAKPGQLEVGIPFGVRVGIGGPGKPPDGKATLADIAGFHQTGGGRLPKREIIVPPNENVQVAMAGDLENAIRKLLP